MWYWGCDNYDGYWTLDDIISKIITGHNYADIYGFGRYKLSMDILGKWVGVILSLNADIYGFGRYDSYLTLSKYF